MLFNKIKVICSKKNISIYRLEKEAGLSSGSICKWNKCTPSVDKIQRISKVLNIEITDLLN